jgi:hypothetical protein
MTLSSIETGLLNLLMVVAAFMVWKHWKNNAWAEIGSVVLIGGIIWAFLSGKDIFSFAWGVVVAILNALGIKVA